MNCEFGKCRVEDLYSKKENLSTKKLTAFYDAANGPNDLAFVESKLKEAAELAEEISIVNSQINIQIVCSKCPWR